MNSTEIKAEIAKVEQELKNLAEEAKNKFNILSGMKMAYHNILSSVETKAKTVISDLEEDTKKDTVKDSAAINAAVDKAIG